MTAPQFVSEEFLRCPVCRSDWTHVASVSMSDAAGHSLTIIGEGEDERCTMRVETTAPEHTGRRQVVGLVIDCEICGNGITVLLKQHKGQTDVKVYISDPD